MATTREAELTKRAFTASKSAITTDQHRRAAQLHSLASVAGDARVSHGHLLAERKHQRIAAEVR